MSDLKLYLLNAFSLTVSFTDIELGLKILLLLVTIGYTITKWADLRKDKDEANK